MPFMSSPMHGAIELPPESNPLTPQTLYNILTRASSTDQQQIQTATQQLQNWENHPGYYSSLQTVSIDKSLPLNVRYLSAIQLKNGIDKYWRKTASNAIKKEEKALIRSRCLDSGVNEPDHRLALQNALLIAKIVRFEFPHDWPDAITSITQHLRLSSQAQTDLIYLPRTLLTLLYVVKVLATGRLQRNRASLQTAAPEVFQVLGSVYVTKVRNWLHDIRNIEQQANKHNIIEQSLIALRVLRRLLIAGYEFPNRNKEVQEFWAILESQFGDISTILTQNAETLSLDFRPLIEKHLVQMSKLHLEMVKIHPAAFALLPNSVGLSQAYWNLVMNFGQTFGSQTAVISTEIGRNGDADEVEMPYMEKVSLKALLLIRGCAKMVYSPIQSFKMLRAEDKVERKQAIELIKTRLFHDDMAREMMETLITRFFVFRPRDLREWEEEPEEWERKEEGEGDVWEFSIRSCAEKLFLDLVINNKDLLTQPLLDVFYTVATPLNDNVLLKDSMYAAIGIGAPVLEQRLDFATFLSSTLVPEIQISQPGYNILRRRIAILLGQWLTIKEGLDRQLVYRIFQYLLQKDIPFNDEVVRVTAGRQLKNVVDPFEFVAETFMPFAQPIINQLMALIEEVNLVETKMVLLNTLSVIVVKMEQHINPFADQIISLLPPLWSQAGDEYLPKQSILGILAALVTSMKDESKRYHSMILPLIESSLQPESESRTYLLEDALDLWGVILIQTSEPAQDVINLTQYLFLMYNTTTETLRKALEITESYFLLAPQAMLQNSFQFLSSFSKLLSTNLKREANGIVTHLIDILLQVAHNLGGPSAIETLAKGFVETELISHIFLGLKRAYDAHQTTGPNRIYSDIDGAVETDYFSVLARVALASPSAFVDVTAIIASARNESFEETINWLLTEWFSHLDNIGMPSGKKLMCLALTSLLELDPQRWVLGRLQELMTLWTDVLVDIVEYPENGGAGKDSMVYWDPEGLKPERQESPEDERRRNLLFADPVHRINIIDFIREHLERLVASCGGQEAFQQDWLSNVDEDVIKAFSNTGVI